MRRRAGLDSLPRMPEDVQRSLARSAAEDPPAHVVIVEDDPDIAELISGFLRSRRFRVTAVADRRSLERTLRLDRADAVLLDIMLAGDDGVEICRQLRSQPGTEDLPILLVSALGSEVDRVRGLDLGADDYIVKPFSPDELVARLRAVLRRAGAATRRTARLALLHFDGWRLDLRRRTLHDGRGDRVALTGAEFALLCVFARAPQRTLSRDALAFELHGRTIGPDDRSIDILVSRLRRKIEPEPGAPQLIRTMRNLGYLFAPEVRAHPAGPCGA
jgi:two-component system OmpR family response regulator